MPQHPRPVGLLEVQHPGREKVYLTVGKGLVFSAVPRNRTLLRDYGEQEANVDTIFDRLIGQPPSIRGRHQAITHLHASLEEGTSRRSQRNRVAKEAQRHVREE